MIWSTPFEYPQETLSLQFLPQLSVQYDEEAATKKRAVAASLLFINATPDSTEATDFAVLCRAFLAWVFNAYFSGRTTQEVNILEQLVTIDDANAIFQYFDQQDITDGQKEAFPISALYDHFFKQGFTAVTITTQQAESQPISNNTVQEVAFFPMLPLLSMTVNTCAPIEFSTFNPCEPDYLKRIRDYFAEMEVQYQKTKHVTMMRDGATLSMAEFLFVDYFVMIAKTAFQAVIEGLEQTPLVIREDDTLNSLADRYKRYGATASSLAQDNRHQQLQEAASLYIPAFTHQLKPGETAHEFLQQFSLQEEPILSSTGVISVPAFQYTIQHNAPATLWTVSNCFGLDFEVFAACNADQQGLFRSGTHLLHAFVETKTVREILDELQHGAAHAMANVAGTVSRFFLHGLRIPKAATGGERIGLYEATGQLFPLTGSIAGQTISLGVSGASPEWLKLGTIGSLRYDFTQDMADAVAALVGSTYVPSLALDSQDDVLRYKLKPKTFEMATSFNWQDPNPQLLKGTPGETFLWTFPSQLQQYLATYPSIAYQLLMQSSDTPFSQANATPIMPLFWGTYVTVNLKRVPVTAMPGSYLENVYIVEGCGETDNQILQHLLHAANAAISNLDILFAGDSTQENEGKKVHGLVSNALTQYSTFLLQTNYPTLSNPGNLGANAVAYGGSNLLGMDAWTFLTCLLECSLVQSGGCYLHYRTATGGGLPDYLFNEEGIGSIQVLVSYTISLDTPSQGYLLPAYVNIAVIDKKIDAQQDTLFASIALTDAQKGIFDPVLQNIQATILPGTGLFQGHRSNPQLALNATATERAEQQLSELFHLLEYCIQPTTGRYKQSDFALPAGPLDRDKNNQPYLSGLPGSLQTEVWNYGAAIPLYRFVDNGTTEEIQQDPYAANGKTATVAFNFLDVFGNTLIEEGVNLVTQSITPGYTDPVIGLDQWINVTRKYQVTSAAESGQPILTIDLIFDALRYQQAEDPKALAKQDLILYHTVANQLAQPGVAASIQCSIGTLKAPEIPPLQILQAYVASIIVFLAQVQANELTEESLTTTFSYGIDPVQLTTDCIFQLHVALTLERTLYVDPQFAKETVVRLATTVVPPDLYSGMTADQIALSHFATNLETALPVMKVAVGSGGHTATTAMGENPPETNPKEVWLVRFATATESGISFTVSPQPVYFSVRPLSTELISRPDTGEGLFPLRAYTTGSYIGDATPVSQALAGIDIELLTQVFVTGIDSFLSAQNSTQAWQVAQSGPCTRFPKPFEEVEAAKRIIAKTVSDFQLINILQQGDFTQLPAARAALEQQLLVLLGNMYQVSAVVQAAVNITNGYEQPTANLYGQLVSTDTTVSKAEYSFSPVKLALTQGTQPLNSLFSVRQEGGGSGEVEDLIDRFKAGLNLQITGIEHNFGTSQNGYTSSSWLTFVHPVLQLGATSTPLIDADIPIPLKVYPTLPALVSQVGTASSETGKDSKEKLAEALLWDYAFAYNYVSSKQDLIYLDVELNVQHSQLLVAKDAPLDLFEALVQFHAVQETVMADIVRNDENSLMALQSFAWLAQQVHHAWPVWFEPKAVVSDENPPLRYIVQETEDQDNGTLLISVWPEKAGVAPGVVPRITIDGFETRDHSSVGEVRVYYFVQATNTSETLLLFSERKAFNERRLVLPRNNVLGVENAWAGVSVHRNEVLAGEPTNIAFQYVTPYIRFVDAYYPSLNNTEPINIATFTPGVSSEEKATLEILFLNFFTELLKTKMTRPVMLQIKASYSYALQPDSDAIIPFGPTLPIVLTQPFNITGATILTVLQPLSTAITDWLSQRVVTGIETAGRIELSVSLFAANGGTKHQPLLTLQGLYLSTNIIDLH